MTAVQEIIGSDNNGNNGNNNNGNNNNGNGIGANSANNHFNYFKLGSLTRRYSVIGCIGYEFANPQKEKEEETKEEETKEEKEKNTCSICLEEQENEQTKNLATTPCGHTFCLTCLLGHLKYNNLCPLCRAPIEENAKKIVTPISYDDGVMLLNHELSSLHIEEDIEQFVQNAIEIAGNSQTDGSNVRSVIDDLMTMVASFGFNLLYDALCHMHHGEENVDPEWQYEMNGSSEDGSEYSGDDEGSESGDDDDDDESEGNLTTISSSSSSDEDDDKVWGKMYQLPDIE